MQFLFQIQYGIITLFAKK